MSSVDDRIVNMEFNNKQFESGATTSMGTLNKLESALTRTGQSKGLTDLGAGAEKVKGHFSAMEVAGVAAVATIASKATALGLHLLKSFTIQPLIDGFHEYQTNLESIQTVMANTDKGLKPVQNALNVLNHYADKTIYDFSQMAHNVGTFTAAGVGLKTSVAAIQGIANVAALSGSNAQQASMAMYQLSQAIAAGRVNLQDWNSVVNAGMGGKKLQTALVQTGIAMGTIDKNTVTMGKHVKIAGDSFRQSISAVGKGKGGSWLTSDVLVNTLKLMDGRLSTASMHLAHMSAPKIAEEMKKQEAIMRKQGYSPKQIASLEKMANNAFKAATTIRTFPQLLGTVREAIGSVWSNAFAQILGNFSESKRLWTSVNNSVTYQVNGLNNVITGMIKGWRSVGGRGGAIQAAANVFHALGKVLGAVSSAFSDVFPSSGNFGETLGHITHAIKYFTAALVPSADTVKSLRSIFGGFFAVLHIGLTIVGGIAKGFGALFGALFQGSGKTTGGILSMLAALGEILKGFDKWLTSGDKVSKFFVGLGTVIGTALNPIVQVIGTIVKAVAGLATGNVSFSGFINSIKDGLSSVGVPFEKFAGLFDKIKASLGSLGGSGGKAAGVFKSIASAMNSISGDKISSLFKSIGSSAGSVAGAGLSMATSIISGLVKGIAGAMPSIISAMVDLGSSIIAAIKAVLGIHSPASTMIPVGQNIVLGIAQGIATGIAALPAAFAKIGNAIKGAFGKMFANMDVFKFTEIFDAVLSGGILVLVAKFISNFGSLSGAVSNILNQLTSNLQAMQRQVQAKALLDIAIAVGILAASLIALSFVPAKNLAKGLGAIAGMMALLVLAMRSMGTVGASMDENGKLLFTFNKNMLMIGPTMIMMATAMLLMSAAVAAFGSMDISTLIKGIAGIAFAMGIMVNAMKSMDGIKGSLVSASAGIVLMATALLILSAAVGAFGNMDFGTLVKGLSAVSIGLSIMVPELVALGEAGPAVAAGGAALLLASAGLLVLSAAIGAFGNMDWGTLAKGFTAMAIGLLLLSVALGALGLVGPAVLAGGAALVLAAVAMNILAVAMAAFLPVILAFAATDWGTIISGVGKIALAIGVIGAVSLIAAPGLLLLGAAMVLAGVGMLTFATGFALLTAVGAAGFAVITAGITTFLALLPGFAIQVVTAFVVFIQTIAKAAPKIRAAVVTIVSNMIQAVQQLIPKFASLLSTMISAGLGVLRNAIPKMITTGFAILNAFLQGLKKNIGGLVTAAVQIIVKFATALGNQAGKLTTAAITLILKFVNALTGAINKNASKLGTAGGKLALALVNGLTGGLLGKGMALVKAAVERLANAIPGPIKKILHIASPSKLAYYWGTMIGAGLAGGLNASIKVAVGATVEMANAVIAAGNAAVARAQNVARIQQIAAAKAQGVADSENLSVSKMPSKTKAQKKAKNAAQKRADAAQKAADAAQARADAANTAVQNARDFENADAAGRGDILKANSQTAADTATKLLARASAEAAEARKFAKTNRKAAADLLAKSKADAAASAKYAAAAQYNQRASLAYYAQSVKDRIKSIEDANAADAKAAADQAAYDAADTQGKIDIMNQRAAADAARAEAAKAQSLALIEQAKKLAATNAVQAMALLDQADTAAQTAKDAADQAASEKDQAAQLAGQTDAAGGASSSVTPSVDVLTQAASVVDRWTQSLLEAQDAAAANQQPMQFVQNNSSPEPISPSEAYRLGKNLVSLAQIKMADT